MICAFLLVMLLCVNALLNNARLWSTNILRSPKVPNHEILGALHLSII